MDSELVMRAAEFARQAHSAIDQRRKYSGEPYIVHPAAVAELVASVTDDGAVIAAAWLHDVVEDTAVTLGEIRTEFGEDVAALVSSVTKVVDGTEIGRAKAAEINIAHCGQGSPRAKTIKLADVIHNLSDIVENDPCFAPVYVREKEMLLDVIGEGDPVLFRRAEALIGEIKRKLPECLRAESFQGEKIMEKMPAALREEILGLLKPVQMIHLATWDGKYPRVRPVSLIFSDGEFWFCTGTNDAKTGQIASHPVFEFSLMLEKGDSRGTLRCSGAAETVSDMETKRAMSARIPFFGDYWETPEDPTFCLVRLSVEMVEYMRPGEMVAQSFSW